MEPQHASNALDVSHLVSLVGKFGTYASAAQLGSGRGLRWIAYVRKSLDDGSDNLSLVDQIGIIRDWATARGDIVVAVHEELASGALPKGPGAFERKELHAAFVSLLASNDYAGLVVVRLDRLSRDMVATHSYIQELTQARKSFVCVNQPELTFFWSGSAPSATSWLSLAMNSLMAQFEREQVRERTKTSVAQRVRRGIGVSLHSPFGTQFEATMPDGTRRLSFSSSDLVGRARSNGKASPLNIVDHPAEREQFLLLAAFHLSALRKGQKREPRKYADLLSKHSVNVNHRNPGKLRTNGNLVKATIKSIKFFSSRDGGSFEAAVAEQMARLET
ncbi:Resolvase [Hyaloraphidium curvatum]|nr:Resolvase [Hyaloraphidium curvatum]